MLKQQFSSNGNKSVIRRKQKGFTLLELAVATVVLLVGIAGVAQLVPASMESNQNNRVDTTAMVFAQRELDQMVNQPLTANTFTDKDGRAISLAAAATNTIYGGPTRMLGTTPMIDFTPAAVAGYNYQFTDPNDPSSPRYEMRWAIIANISGGVTVSKRFIVGCRKTGATQFVVPAVVDSLVEN